MHRSLRNLLLLATTGALFPASFAWSRDLPNVDALANAVPRPQTKIAQKTPTSVQRIVRDEQLGVASFVWFDPATRAAAPVSAVKRVASDPVAAARAEFKAVASLYGVTEAELDASPAQLHSSPSSATKLVRFTGQRDGVPVFREQATVLLNAQSQALNIGGYLGSTKLAPLVKSATATRLSPAMAAQIALQDFEFGKDIAARFYVPESRRKDDASGYRWIDLPNEVTGADGAALEQPIRYRPVWFRLPQGLVSAIYLEVRVFEAGEHHAYSYVVASEGGQLLFRNQQSSHQAAPQSPSSATFSYGVWADPQTGVPYPGPQGLDLSPYPNAGPDGYSARLIGPSRLTLASVPFSKSDSWVDSGVNSQRIYFTYGNNVRAWADAASPNGYDGMAVGDISACKGGQQAADMDFYACTTDAAFDYNYDFSSGPLKNQAQASASVVNMFYTLNWLHDWFYNAGFDEASGNAQASNFGRGGVESDPIDARALVSGVRNNASMDAPADGASPILRGYIYDYGEAPARSAALDNSVVSHEWAHYMSKRLVGNANGLTTRLATGLGEGWSDFVAQLVTVTEKDRSKPGNDQYQGAYAHAVYANSGSVYPATDWRNATYFGSRRYPYSTDMGKNPLTFKHIQDGEALPANVPVNRGLVDQQVSVTVGNSGVHNVGEVWASMLWECYASLLNRHEFNDAKRRMSNYLVTGMKLTPINPTFIEVRDALLAGMVADDPQDYASCLGAFAKRGAGLDAQAPDRYSIDLRGVAESYSAGPLVIIDDLRLTMRDRQAKTCDADDVLDNGETAVLRFNLINRGDREVTGIVLALQSGNPHIAFPQGKQIALDRALAPGRSLSVSAPVFLSGMTGYMNASIAVNIAATDQQAVARGQAVSAWLNADIKQQDSRADAVDVWPGGLQVDGSGWSIAGDDSNHWYQLAVPNRLAVTTIYSPELKVSDSEDLVLTFDHEYDFGNDATNGAQLVISRSNSADEVLNVEGIGYTGEVWWMRNGVANTNQLRSQRAYIGKTKGWQRNLEVNLGRRYAGMTVRIGWRTGSADMGNPDSTQFWRVDNIRLSGLDNKPFASIRMQEKICPDLEASSGASGPATPPEGAASQPTSLNDTGIDPSTRPSGSGVLPAITASTEGAAGAPGIWTVINGVQVPLQSAKPSVDSLLANQAAEPVTVNATAVPSLSSWGLMAMTLVLGVLGGMAQMRRRFKA